MKNAWLRVCTLKQLSAAVWNKLYSWNKNFSPFEAHDQILYIDKSKVRIFHNLDFLKGIE